MIKDFKAFMKPKETKIQTNRKIIGYTRVSSKQQAENYSIDEQEREIREYAKRNHYTVEKIIGGTHESASGDFDRKEFKRLYDGIKASKTRPFAIAIKFINRFSRTGANAISIVHELIEKLGVQLIETSSGLCTENIADRVQIYHKLLEAQQENHERLARTIPGLKAFLKQGNRLGRAPFGYTTRGTRVKDYDRKCAVQKIEINPQGRLFASAWQWKLQGETDTAILKRLEGLGILLTKQQISKNWRNPFYCGMSINKLLDEPCKGNWEPMVTVAHFWKIQAILNPSKAGTYQVSSNNDNRPLARFLKCYHCSTLLTGYEVKTKGVHYYKCNHCLGVNMNANTTRSSRNKGLNDSFKDLLKGVNLQDKYVGVFRLQLQKLFKTLNVDTSNELTQQKNTLGELTSNLQSLEKKFLFGNSVTEEVYLRHKNGIDTQILEKEKAIADLESKLSNHDEFIENAITVCRNISKQWEFGDSDNKQRIQKVLFPDGLVVIPENRSYLTDNMNQVFKLIPCLTSVSEDAKKEKVGNDADLSPLVARRRLELPTSGL